MSKYIELKLALNKLWRLCEEDIEAERPEAFEFARAQESLQSLPIIEVSEDCISREYVKCINCAENGSYKCSKCDGEMYYKYDKDEPQTYITEDRDTQILDAWQVHHRNTTTVEDTPSVVPKEGIEE